MYLSPVLTAIENTTVPVSAPNRKNSCKYIIRTQRYQTGVGILVRLRKRHVFEQARQHGKDTQSGGKQSNCAAEKLKPSPKA